MKTVNKMPATSNAFVFRLRIISLLLVNLIRVFKDSREGVAKLKNVFGAVRTETQKRFAGALARSSEAGTDDYIRVLERTNGEATE
jgi:hypothetical protein